MILSLSVCLLDGDDGGGGAGLHHAGRELPRERVGAAPADQQDVVALKPKVVHIMAGTNDIGGATGAITEDEFAANIRAMLDMAKANQIAVVLAGIPPMSRLLPRPDFDTRPAVPRLNARLKKLAAEYGAEWVDYFAPLAASDGSFDPAFANDGVHPTRAGYAVMEPLAAAAVSAALGGKK